MSSGDLSVFLHGARIGTLRRSGAKARFVFNEECAEALDETLENLAEGVSRASDIYPEAGERHAKPTMQRIARLVS